MTKHQLVYYEGCARDSPWKRTAKVYFMLKREGRMDTRKLREKLLRDLDDARHCRISTQQARAREGLARVILQSRELEYEYNDGETIKL